MGAVALAAGLGWLSRLGGTTTFLSGLAGPLLLTGAGVGLSFVPLTLAAVVRTDEATSGISSAVINTCQQVGSSLGLAVFGTIAATATRHRGGGMAESLAHGYGVAYLIAALSVLAAGAIAVLTVREASDPSGSPALA
ncbi:hypothetical protein [Nocardia sp. NPDC020380]|uniref:hypothetical protein n=1 Tax=Nocardia sp. NPDC020380 TaxID=3364309 RepID=UPI00378C464D